MKFWYVLLLTILICGCKKIEEQQRVDSENSSPTLAFEEVIDPVYKDSRTFRGFYSSGFESSSITLCIDNSERCKIARFPDGTEEMACWAEFTDKSSEKLRAYKEIKNPELTDNYGVSYEHELVFQGKYTNHPGYFGHLGQYVCQILVEDIISIKPSYRLLEPIEIIQ